MGLSRTSWAMSLAYAVHHVLRDYRLSFESLSYPYPDGAMNIATNHFYASTADRMIVIDTDLIFQPVHLETLLMHDCELVFGIYPQKRFGLHFPVVGLDGDPEPFADDGRPLLREMARCAKGFMSVSRAAFDRLRPITPCHDGMQFEFWRNLPGGHSEDYAFCDAFRSVGGKVMVDIGICLQHEGSARYPIEGTFSLNNERLEKSQGA